jgi:hypothetical protein
MTLWVLAGTFACIGSLDTTTITSLDEILSVSLADRDDTDVLATVLVEQSDKVDLM